MKVLTVFYTLILGLLVPLTVFSDLASYGVPTCESSFDGNWFEGSSKPKIIEKYKWIDLDSMYPKLKKTEVKPASIFGKVKTSQSTYGTGVVGVKAVGNVTGPNFEMEIGPEFNINAITLLDYLTGDAWYDTTKKSATAKKDTDVKGTYTLNGSGEVIAVSGGGGITVNGTGFRTSGTVSFSFSPTAEAKTLDVEVEQDKPNVYTCQHQDCDVELPSSDHHLITCGKNITNHHGGVGTCKVKYYICQSNCLIHADTDDDTASTPDPPSTPSYHACGVHEDWQSGDHFAASCGHSRHFVCDGLTHQQVQCTETNGNGDQCTYTYWQCLNDSTPSHNHVYPESTPEPSGTTCANGHTYNPNSNWAVNHHRARTCRYGQCRQTWQRCSPQSDGSLTPMCSSPNRAGERCWAE